VRLLSLFFPALICSLLIPVIKRRDGRHTPCAYAHLTKHFLQQQPCLFCTRVEAQNRKSPALAFCSFLRRLSCRRHSPNPRAHRLLTDFSASAQQIITISHRAHIHPIAGCRHRKISCSSKSLRERSLFPLLRHPLFPYFIFSLIHFLFICMCVFFCLPRILLFAWTSSNSFIINHLENLRLIVIINSVHVESKDLKNY
jgi:hypothetical protein